MSVIRVLVVAVVFAIAVSSVSGTKKQSSGGGGGWGQQQQGGWGQQSSGGGGFDIGGIFQKKIGKIGKLVSAKTGIIKKLLSPILAIKSKKAGLVGKLLAPKLKIFRQKFSKLGNLGGGGGNKCSFEKNCFFFRKKTHKFCALPKNQSKFFSC